MPGEPPARLPFSQTVLPATIDAREPLPIDGIRLIDFATELEHREIGAGVAPDAAAVAVQVEEFIELRSMLREIAVRATRRSAGGELAQLHQRQTDAIELLPQFFIRAVGCDRQQPSTCGRRHSLDKIGSRQ